MATLPPVTLDKVEYDYYVEKSSNLLCEAQVFDGFALVRPANPWFYGDIQKLSSDVFDRDFDLYLVDPELMAKVVVELGEATAIH